MSFKAVAFERHGSLIQSKKSPMATTSLSSVRDEMAPNLTSLVDPLRLRLSSKQHLQAKSRSSAFHRRSDCGSAFSSIQNPHRPTYSPGPTSMSSLEDPSLSCLPHLPPSFNTEGIYESLYDARWKSMLKEDARLQRESVRWNLPSPPGSVASSREGSVGPGAASNAWGHPEPSTESMSKRNNPPRRLALQKTSQDSFGFTLRHCIVYAPERHDGQRPQPEMKETIFVKSIKPEGPAYRAGMRRGDRIMSVNGEQVAGKTYSHVVQSIKAVPDVLYLTVLPQEEDVIQKYFFDIAQNPETNQPSIQGSPALSQKSFHSQRGALSNFMPIDSSEHLYEEPAQIRENRYPSPIYQRSNPDEGVLNRIQRDFEMKEKFMNRPPEDFKTTIKTREDQHKESRLTRKDDRSRNLKSKSPSQLPRPMETFVDGSTCSKGDSGSSLPSPKSHSQSIQSEIEAHASSNALIMDRIREEGAANSETMTTAPHQRYRSHDHVSSRRSSAASETPPPSTTTTTTAFLDSSRYPASSYSETRQSSHTGSTMNPPIRRRPKPTLTQEETDEKNLRRASYLRATKNEDCARNVALDPSVINTTATTSTTTPDTDFEMVTSTSKALSSSSSPLSSSSTTTKKLQSSGAEKLSFSSNSIQRSKARIGEKTDSSQEDLESHGPIQDEEIKQGWLQIKVMALEGKKANDRSWKNVYAVIRSNRMFMYKDKKVATESPQSTEEDTVPLAESYVHVADDYTKRKNVFRIKTRFGSEYLCQADQEQDMKEWIKAIESSNVHFVVDERKDSGSGGVLIPGGSGGGVRGLKKLTSFRNRSPSLHSPAAKSRKPSQDPMPSRDTTIQTSYHGPSNPTTTTIATTTATTTTTAHFMTSSVPNQDSAGPMTATEETKRDKKTLMGKMAKQWKKIQHGSPAMPQTLEPESGSIGVPLENCPMSEDPNHERVPKLVTTCCKIVEERGLEIVGVYRVPGNTAAVKCLIEQLRAADPEEAFKMDDYRWNDVNVVSSLLKSFFRKLPEPLFTAELYPRFVKASMIEDSGQRLHTLKKLIQALPSINLDTLEFVIGHLTKVIDFSNINKMEVKNLAIVFGPTLVRPDGDDMMLMVTDMAQQCRIIESILTHAEWFFNNEPVDEHAVSSFILDCAEPQTVIAQTAHESILLTNLQKLEYQGKVQSPSRDMSAKEVVSSIISAAQRKKNRPSAPYSHKVSPNPIMVNSQRIVPEQQAQTPPMSENNSRRNSESMMQAVSGVQSCSNQESRSNNERSPAQGVGASYLNLPSTSYMKKISASAENINRVCNLSVQQLQSSPSRKFPLTESTTTYQNESNRESPGKTHFRSDLLPGPESPTLDAWKSNSDQILLQEPYPTQAYNSDPADAKNRFLTRTYFKRNADPRLPINRVHSASNLMESLAEFDSSQTTTAPLGALKRHQLQKCATESTLAIDAKKSSPNKSTDDVKTQAKTPTTKDQEKEEEEENRVEASEDDRERGKIISQLNTFDESLRLLIDPNSQSGPDSHGKANPQRRMSAITVVNTNPSPLPPSSSSTSSATSNAKTSRSISVGGRPPQLALKDKRNHVSRKSELKRGKLVDKKKQHSPTLINFKRNDSLNKKEKQKVNIRQKAAEKENNNTAQKLWEEHLLKDPTAASKIIKTLSNQSQIKRRNTVGSPNDIENQGRKSKFSINHHHRRTAPMTIGHRWSSMDSAGSNEDEGTELEEPRTEDDEDEEQIVDNESEDNRLRGLALTISKVGQRPSETHNGSTNDSPPAKMPSLLESQV